MEYIAAFTLGAFFNRIRGGLWEKYVKYGKIINVLAFGAFIFFFTTSYSQVAVLYAFLMMYAGQSLGWGDYIGALGGWRTQNLSEVDIIDEHLENYLDRPKLWGFLGLTVRGLLWGLCLGLALSSFWPVVAGLLMGAIYYLAIEVERVLGKSKAPDDGWELGEYLFGGVLWAACLL